MKIVLDSGWSKLSTLTTDIDEAKQILEDFPPTIPTHQESSFTLVVIICRSHIGVLRLNVGQIYRQITIDQF